MRIVVFAAIITLCCPAVLCAGTAEASGLADAKPDATNETFDGAMKEALAHINAGGYRLALTSYKQAAKLAPREPAPRWMVGLITWHLSYQNKSADFSERAHLLQTGMASLKKALALNPKQEQASVYLRLIYLEFAKYASDEEQKRAWRELAAKQHKYSLALKAKREAEGALKVAH